MYHLQAVISVEGMLSSKTWLNNEYPSSHGLSSDLSGCHEDRLGRLEVVNALSVYSNCKEKNPMQRDLRKGSNSWLSFSRIKLLQLMENKNDALSLHGGMELGFSVQNVRWEWMQPGWKGVSGTQLRFS